MLGNCLASTTTRLKCWTLGNERGAEVGCNDKSGFWDGWRMVGMIDIRLSALWRLISRFIKVTCAKGSGEYTDDS